MDVEHFGTQIVEIFAQRNVERRFLAVNLLI
jgi:hypothetical protein